MNLANTCYDRRVNHNHVFYFNSYSITFFLLGSDGLEYLSALPMPAKLRIGEVKPTRIGSVSGVSASGSTEETLVIHLPNGEQRTLSNNFLEWLRGFTDAEGCFFIGVKQNVNYFSFTYTIQLHIDDIQVLY